MAKLQKYVRSVEEKAHIKRLFEDALSESDDEKLSNEMAEHTVSHGPLYYIERYRATGEYYDIDYPGGMLGLIADYEAGKFDDCAMLEASVRVSNLTPGDIVDGYLDSGMYANLDYPGGIEQFVKDYRDGKFN